LLQSHAAWTKLAPYKDQHLNRGPSDNIGNVYSPQAAAVPTKTLAAPARRVSLFPLFLVPLSTPTPLGNHATFDGVAGRQPQPWQGQARLPPLPLCRCLPSSQAGP
jgi:hypothetical protein